MESFRQHKPGCMANTICTVYHADGVCQGPYGKCTCDQIKEKNMSQDEFERICFAIEKEIAEEVEKLPPYYVEDSGEKMISSSEVLKILNNK